MSTKDITTKILAQYIKDLILMGAIDLEQLLFELDFERRFQKILAQGLFNRRTDTQDNIPTVELPATRKAVKAQLPIPISQADTIETPALQERISARVLARDPRHDPITDEHKSYYAYVMAYYGKDSDNGR